MKVPVSIAFAAIWFVSSLVSSAQSFEVATMRLSPPGGEGGTWSLPNKGVFVAKHLALKYLLQIAYQIDISQVENLPSWSDDTFYDINARPEDGVKLSREELKPRLQALLSQRLHLIVHHETRNKHGFTLVIAKGGPKLTPTTGKDAPGTRQDVHEGHIEGYNWTMPYLARMVTPGAGFPVVDRTGLSGSYDINFVYEPNPEAQSDLPPLADALRKSVGLELKPAFVPVDTIVIDSVDRVPAEN